MPGTKALYSFHPSVFALVNKNAFANLGPFNIVDTATGASIKFQERSTLLFALVLVATLAAASFASFASGNLLLVPPVAAFSVWAFHHLFGAPIFWSVRKRLSYEVTEREVVFERGGLRDAVPLASIRAAFVIPTATMGIFGYRNIGAVYRDKGRSHGFFLYGAPNRDLNKICALLTKRRKK